MERRVAAWRLNRLRAESKKGAEPGFLTQAQHGRYKSLSNVRRDCGGLRCYRRLGGQTAFGSRLDSSVARSRAQHIALRIHGAHARLQAAFPRYVARDREDAGGAEAVLRVHGV